MSYIFKGYRRWRHAKTIEEKYEVKFILIISDI